MASRALELMIDATPLLLRGAGIKTYLYYWLRALDETKRPNGLRCFPVLSAGGLLDTERSVAGSVRSLVSLSSFYVSTSVLGGAMRYLLTRGVDVFHISSHLRRAPPVPLLTATIFDLTCWIMPEAHTPANVRATKSFGETMWRKARRLIAISQSAKDDAIRVLKIPPEKIEVIYPGVAESFFQVSGAQVERVKTKNALRFPYLLFLGTIEPRKNIGRLLNAWTHLPKSLQDRSELIIAGPFGWESEQLRHRLALTDRVRYLGPLPEEDLAGLTAGAQAFVFPSLYEGFGLPVAQAMACGVPVLTSNNSSLAEITGDCGVQFDPYSETEMSNAIGSVVQGGERWKTYGDAGRLRSKAFHWRKNALESWRFFEGL